MDILIIAKLDKRGSETLTRNHFTLNDKGDSISGGLYIDKEMGQPDRIIIEFKKDKED